MEQFLLEPVELTDTELDVVAGGLATSAAASAVGDNAAVSFGVSGFSLTTSSFTVTAVNAALAAAF